MTLYFYDFSEYAGTVEFDSEDYETEFTAYVDECYDGEADVWNEDAIRASAEEQAKAHFGADTIVIWEAR